MLFNSTQVHSRTVESGPILREISSISLQFHSVKWFQRVRRGANSSRSSHSLTIPSKFFAFCHLCPSFDVILNGSNCIWPRFCNLPRNNGCRSTWKCSLKLRLYIILIFSLRPRLNFGKYSILYSFSHCPTTFRSRDPSVFFLLPPLFSPHFFLLLLHTLLILAEIAMALRAWPHAQKPVGGRVGRRGKGCVGEILGAWNW